MNNNNNRKLHNLFGVPDIMLKPTPLNAMSSIESRVQSAEPKTSLTPLIPPQLTEAPSPHTFILFVPLRSRV